MGAIAPVVVLVAALLPALTTSVASAAHAVTRETAATSRIAVPALVSDTTLRATLPAGGTVSYDLPALPAGAVRVFGDWNGDGAQTVGSFADGTWQLYNQVMRSGNGATVTFGQPGDVPVTGDWNGDGTTDLGVVRGDHWLLALGPVPNGGTASVWRDVTFPGAGTPVTGDWDGDGLDGIGWFEGRHWTLANSLDAPTAVVDSSYGAPGDVPVVGDWDGDGVDGIGVLRGDQWYLSNRAVRPRTALDPVLSRTAGDTPASWPVPMTTPGATTCPTASDGRRGQSGWVVPSTALTGALPAGLGRTAYQVRGSLLDSQRYLLGAQYAALWRATRSRPYLDLIDSARGDELSIRLPAMSALTVAIGLRTGAFDPKSAGRSRAFATRYVDQLVRSIACSHVSITPGGWGKGWETAHWAMLTGAAAWLVWDKLTPQTRSDVTSMVVSEADRLTNLDVPVWATSDGTVLTPGDTKAEEDAWNASLLDFAAAMMPRAPHAASWRAKAAQFAVTAYSVRSDVTSTATVNGVPLDQRLAGYNAYPDGTVENHHRIHPDYASNIQLLWTAADFDRLARLRVPQAMFHNAGLVYGAFSTRVYQAGAASPAGGTFAAPGGTVYQPGHSWIYYPQGDDWGTARRAHFVSLDAHADVYARYLRASGWPAAKALVWHERGQQNLVAGSGATDGRTYSVNPAVAAQQDTYPGREEYAAQNLATAWLALYVGHLGIPRLDRSTLAVPPSTTPPTKVSSVPRAPSGAHLGP